MARAAAPARLAAPARRAIPGRVRRRRHRGAAAGAALLALFSLTALFAPAIARQDPLAQQIDRRLAAPSRAHLLGTDHLGRDLFSRLVYGSRISLAVGLTAVAMGGVVGSVAGLVGGYWGGWADRAVVLVVDIFLTFPTILVALAIVALLGSGLLNVVLAIALAVWPGIARVVRGTTIRVRAYDFVEAARALGASDARILFRHVAPNTVGPLVVMLTFEVGAAILTEASLGFLGVGVPPPLPTWGAIVSEGRDYLRTAPWAIAFGGAAISLTVLALNLLGDGLRDILDPTFRRQSMP